MTSFFALLVGTLLVVAAAVFIIGSYQYMLRNVPRKHQVIKDVVQLVGMANTYPADQVTKELRNTPMVGFQVRIMQHPPKKGQLLPVLDRNNIANIIRADFRHFSIVAPLENGKYLHVWGVRSKQKWITQGLVFSLLVLFFALFFICAWAVRRMASPIVAIGEAAQRFGRDIQAPPVAVTGSGDTKAVITTFNNMQKRIRRLLNDRTQMLAAISHDLRTPITRLKLRVEYLKDKEQQNKAIADLDQMENMITSVLAFARDHVSEEAATTFDLNGLLESLCDDLLDAGNDIEYQGLQGRIAYNGRMIAMKRALANIIDNALKYGKEVSVILEKQENSFVIQVRDTGPGIPDKEKERAFAPFYRVDPSRSHAIHGTGLGLAVTRDIIHAAGGEIELRDSVPHGLIVLIRLPFR